MLIVNADDWGRCRAETDAALACYSHGSVSSVSAMVFMEDSERAAELARSAGLDVGLHLNLTEPFSCHSVPAGLRNSNERTARYLRRSKYAPLLYHPGLRDDFRRAYAAQAAEFLRLYGRDPSHVDGHLHMHQCANMLLDGVIPTGMKVRRNFSFWPGEKSLLNRTYRGLIDNWLGRRYRLTDFFFSLESCLKSQRLPRVVELARTSTVELMTHPIYPAEYAFLTGRAGEEAMHGVEMGSYASS